jgi:membrane protein
MKPRYTRLAQKEFLTFFVIVLFLMVNVMFGNEFLSKIIISPSFLVLSVFCIFLYTRLNLQNVIAHLQYMSVIIGVFVIINALTLIGETSEEIANFYMAIGYTLSLQAMILFEISRIRKKKYFSYIAICFSVVAMIFGNRGALLVILVYALINFLFISKKNASTENRIFTFVVILVMIIVFVIFHDTFFLLLYSVIKSMGIESRTLDKLVLGSFTTSLARNAIYENALNIIKINPLIPKGIGYMTTLSLTGIYTFGGVNTNAHNIVLELLIEYGVVIGSIIFLVVLNKVIRSIKFEIMYSDNSIVSLSFCLLLQSIIQLFFSSSLYESNELWIGLVLLSLTKYQALNKLSK